MTALDRLALLLQARGTGGYQINITRSADGLYTISTGPGSRIHSGETINKAALECCVQLVHDMNEEAERFSSRAKIIRAAIDSE